MTGPYVLVAKLIFNLANSLRVESFGPKDQEIIFLILHEDEFHGQECHGVSQTFLKIIKRHVECYFWHQAPLPGVTFEYHQT